MSKERAAQLVEAGIWLKLSGDREGARKLFERASRLDPENVKLRALLDAAEPETPKSDELAAQMTPPPPSVRSVITDDPFAPPADAPPPARELDWGMATGFRSENSPPPIPPVTALPVAGAPPPPLPIPISSASQSLESDWGFLTGSGSPPPRAPPVQAPTNDAAQREKKETLHFNQPSAHEPVDEKHPRQRTLVWPGSDQAPSTFHGLSANAGIQPLTISISGDVPLDTPPPLSSPPLFERDESEEEVVLATVSVSPVPGTVSLDARVPLLLENEVDDLPTDLPPIGDEPLPAPAISPSRAAVSTTALSWLSAMPPEDQALLVKLRAAVPTTSASPAPPLAGEEPDYPKELDPWATDTSRGPSSSDPTETPGFAWSWSASASPPTPDSLKPRFTPSAESAWDASNNPGIKLDPVQDTNRALELIEPGRSTRSGVFRREKEIEVILRGARDLLDLDDHSGAMELIRRAEVLAPDDPDVQALKSRSEQTLLTMFESKLGKLESVPRVMLKDDEIIWLNLDHRAGFVLAQIDGQVTFDDLFSVSGMSRLDTARILAQLIEEGVISRG